MIFIRAVRLLNEDGHVAVFRDGKFDFRHRALFEIGADRDERQLARRIPFDVRKIAVGFYADEVFERRNVDRRLGRYRAAASFFVSVRRKGHAVRRFGKFFDVDRKLGPPLIVGRPLVELFRIRIFAGIRIGEHVASVLRKTHIPRRKPYLRRDLIARGRSPEKVSKLYDARKFCRPDPSRRRKRIESRRNRKRIRQKLFDFDRFVSEKNAFDFSVGTLLSKVCGNVVFARRRIRLRAEFDFFKTRVVERKFFVDYLRAVRIRDDVGEGSAREAFRPVSRFDDETELCRISRPVDAAV